MQNLIIYKFTSLYHILEELSLDLNFNISFVDDVNSLNNKLKNHNNYLIISNKKYLDISNQFVLENTPINIFKLVEKINIEFLKLQFNSQSHVKVKNYIIDLDLKPFNFIGKISYGIYVYHPLVIFFFVRYFGFFRYDVWYNYILMVFLILIITILISYISFVFFERYFIKMKDKYSSVKSRA